jgi:hypothetical protein
LDRKATRCQVANSQNKQPKIEKKNNREKQIKEREMKMNKNAKLAGFDAMYDIMKKNDRTFISMWLY